MMWTSLTSYYMEYDGFPSVISQIGVLDAHTFGATFTTYFSFPKGSALSMHSIQDTLEQTKKGK